MAQVKSVIVMNGAVDGMVFYTRNGRTYVRRRPTRRTNPHYSEAQLRNMMSWTNVIHLWRCFWTGRPTFETLKEGTTHYNMFVSANRHGELPILSRHESANNGCVVFAAWMSLGSLPAIAVEADGVGCRTDVAVGSWEPTEQSTVADFSRAVLRNNKGFAPGDTLRYWCAEQRIIDDVPSAVGHMEYVTLNRRNYSKLKSGHGFAVRDGFVASNWLPLGGQTWVHERPMPSGRILHSPQQLVVNNSALLQQCKIINN